ncbi:MAG TPA: hypothetical protein VF507_10295 [Pyrinomonadaceae bacterium]
MPRLASPVAQPVSGFPAETVSSTVIAAWHEPPRMARVFFLSLATQQAMLQAREDESEVSGARPDRSASAASAARAIRAAGAR